MKTHQLTNASFHLEISRATGALTRLTHPADAHAMNWVCSPEETPWQPLGHGWGLGYVVANWPGDRLHRWQEPVRCEVRKSLTRSVYQLPMLQVTATRRLTRQGWLEEVYEFTNTTAKPLEVWGVALATPWNDNYPNTATCLTRRCNAHLWCADNVMYACGLRMGGAAPHLGLVMTEGCIGGYSIFDRGMTLGGSNLRGTILLNHTGFKLEPGASQRVAWRLFWHTGPDDFYAQARQIPGFVDLAASAYTTVVGRDVQISIAAPAVTGQVTLTYPEKTAVPSPAGHAPAAGSAAGGAAVAMPGAGAGSAPAGLLRAEPLKAVVRPQAPGDCVVTAAYGEGRRTWLRLLAVPPVAELIRARVNFILDRQQVNDAASPFYGALVPYDNAAEAQFRNPRWTDQNEGRERLGMGVLLALWARREPSPRLEQALRRYHRFVRSKLQEPDGTVLDGVGSPHQRLYNYPWFAHLHLELFRTYGDAGFLDDFIVTCREYYRRGGQRFYCIDMPILEGIETLRAAGRTGAAEDLLGLFRQHADELVHAGVNFPPHEVNFEQTIVSPAVWIPLEFYQLTREPQYLAHVRQIMPLLEAFNGRQPDHHLNGISIRHWDGFWFGRRRLWGDTFPHYWSSVSGFVFYRYWQATGEAAFRAKARNTLLNNLSLFTPDGRGSCAHIYPDAVNGEPGRLNDELANDQDWALVFLLQAAEIDPEFATESW